MEGEACQSFGLVVLGYLGAENGYEAYLGYHVRLSL